MKIAIGNDHAGYQLRDVAIKVIEGLGHEVVDFGVASEDHAYTTPIAEKVGTYVVSHQTKGILICGSGVGMSIAANKIPGIRCVCCSDNFSCASSRAHNNTNILAIGARVVGAGLAETLIRTWLTTEYEGGRREVAYGLISDLEEKYLKHEEVSNED